MCLIFIYHMDWIAFILLSFSETVSELNKKGASRKIETLHDFLTVQQKREKGDGFQIHPCHAFLLFYNFFFVSVYNCTCYLISRNLILFLDVWVERTEKKSRKIKIS